MRRYAPRHRIYPRTPVRCDVCARRAGDAKLLRLSLAKSANLPDGRHTTRGAGYIDLCQGCYADLARHHWKSPTLPAKKPYRPIVVRSAAELQPIPIDGPLCSIRDCDWPVAAAMPRGRRPVRCEQHVRRRAA